MWSAAARLLPRALLPPVALHHHRLAGSRKGPPGQRITKKLNELFAHEQLHAEQRDTAAGLDDIGTDWTDERW